jgi:quercetin dioxygenase-like cupin family protein
LIGEIDNVMNEKKGKGTIDSYDDYLNNVTEFTQMSEEGEEEIPDEMGKRLKKARERRGLSIFEVYLRTDLDVDLLSQIEEGKVIPPLGTIIKLAKALHVKMGYFISGEEGKAYTIVRQGDREVTSRYGSEREKHYGYEYESLAPHKTDRQMEPFLITLEPSETDEERSTHDGQEFIFVLHGEMEVRLGEEIHILEPGDSIYYESTVPHLVKCHGKESTKILAVLYEGR